MSTRRDRGIKQLKDGRWQSRFPSHRNNNGKISYRTKIVGYSKRKAERHYREHYSDFMEREILRIPHEPEKRKEYSLSELLDWYLNLEEVKELKSYKDVVGRTKPLKEYFGDRKAQEVQKSCAREYRRWRKEQKAKRNESICSANVASASVNREVACLRRCYNLAIEEGIVKDNPCSGLKSLEENERDRICSPEEFKSLKRELHQEARDIITVAYYTGMRISEITGLDWSRVYLTKRYGYLRKQDTKNKTPRTVPFLHPDVLEVFERLGENPRRIHGKVFGIKSIRSSFDTACKNLGIKNLRIHDFRHTAATNMRKSGIATSVVMKICGWKSVQMFMRYDRVAEEDVLQANVAMLYVEGKASEIPLTGKVASASKS